MKFKFIKEMGLFIESPNFPSESEKPISEFEPFIRKKIRRQNMKTGDEKNTYMVAVKDIHENIGEERLLTSLENLPYFQLFGQPDSLLTPRTRSLLTYKLQQEATKAETEIIPFYPPGHYRAIDGNLVMVLGDCLISSATENIHRINPEKPYCIKKKAPNLLPSSLWHEEGKRFISFFPGVTEPVFYSSFLAVMAPFLEKFNLTPDFVTVLIGKSGSMKTSIIRKYALWLEHPKLQEINFQSSNRMPEILSRIDELTGMNFLMDDLHNLYGTQAKNQQRDRLDKLTRHICGNPQCANIFITGESMNDMSIFSAYDRMFQISIKPMSPETLQKLKQDINTLPDSFMSQLALEFTRKLISNYENVLDDIHKFLENYKPFVFEDPSIRISRHIQILRLTEHLYRLYMCRNNDQLSCKATFEKALIENATYQQKILLQQRKSEEPVNYLNAVYECLSANDAYVTVIPNVYEYQPSENTCLLEDSYIYITSAALVNALNSYLGIAVRLTDVSKTLKNAGVLDCDLDSFSKKKKNVRHYAIHWTLLTKAYETHNAS